MIATHQLLIYTADGSYGHRAFLAATPYADVTKDAGRIISRQWRATAWALREIQTGFTVYIASERITR